MENICVMMPCYSRDGHNCTKVILDDGRDYIEKVRIRTMMKRMYEHYMMDARAYERKLRSKLGPGPIPVRMSAEKVYLPIKMRKPFGRDDGAFGWVNALCIVEVAKVSGGVSSIRLQNGVDLEVLESVDVIERKRERVTLIDELFRKTRVYDHSAQLCRPVMYGDLVEFVERIEDMVLAIREQSKDD